MSPSQNGSDISSVSTVFISLNDQSQVGEARRAAARVAGLLGFNESETGKVALVATEAATNLVKHAGGGELLLRPVEQGGGVGIEVLALDKGPGIANVERCLRDGFSTAGTPGNGLGAIVRVADEFDIYTFPPKGTVLVARLWGRSTGKTLPGAAAFGAISVAKAGEPVCGDSWAIEGTAEGATILVADGLGHGQQAAAASAEAVRIFRQHYLAPPAELLERIHGALKSTRGAAAAIADIRFDEQLLHFAGIGNISATIFADASRSLVSHNGTVGHEVRKIQAFAYPFPTGALVVMHSDGLATHWRLDQYVGLVRHDPSLIAGVLFRDFKRGRDDATVLALRASRTGAA